ncbi:dihydrofolate reductase [Dokdonia sp. PRO95]|uniref:dihydrofolate reductase n=1 Tax=Dokdonia sp. PRO95 TaxID=1239415 RepID=UPI00054DF1FA|nr:dihydrofolate reductase [Dokdonia sp. PRO95]
MITMIAAAAENNALGKDGNIPWHLPDDFKHFKQITTGHHIIMGRKTWESFPRPLPNRTHIVITRDLNYKAENAIVVHSLEDALAYSKDEKQVFIIGGGEIYTLGMDYATHIELTRVHNEYEADAFFPTIDTNTWKLTKSVFHDVDDRHKSGFTFETWKKTT